jgi:hypothetical protein
MRAKLRAVWRRVFALADWPAVNRSSGLAPYEHLQNSRNSEQNKCKIYLNHDHRDLGLAAHGDPFRFDVTVVQSWAMRVSLALLLGMIGLSTAEAAQCPFEKAVYGNIGTDFELRFGPGTAGSRHSPAVFLRSTSAKLDLSGDVVWSNGAMRPYISIFKPDSEEELYSAEIYGLGVNRKRNVVSFGFPSLDDVAVPSLLLPNFSASFYNQLRDEVTVSKWPQDIFYLARCE